MSAAPMPSRRLLLVALATSALASLAAAGTPCPGDADASGIVDVGDLITVILDWGCTGPPGACAGDVSIDGAVTAGDLVAVVLHWGPCQIEGLCAEAADTCPGIACQSDCDGAACCAAACAAEAGLTIAAQVLAQEGSRFVITRSEVDAPYAEDLWLGTYDIADGTVLILPAADYAGDPSVASLAEAVLDAHNQIEAAVPLPCPADEAAPHIDTSGVLRVKPMALTAQGWAGPYFRLKYELLPDEPCLRVTSQGVVGHAARTLQNDYCIDKRIEFAAVSPSRIMIGKNVLIEGAIGTRYGVVAGELMDTDGDPLVMRSDFRLLDTDLDAAIDLLVQQIVAHDSDGDNRLRLDHSEESQGLVGQPDLVDHDGDGAVDDFDLFLNRYDADGDGRVVFDPALAGGLPSEFAGIDDQLGPLIDQALPDRNGDGVIDGADTALGYHDGILDALDTYAKVRGRLALAVTRAAWEQVNGASYQALVRGAIRNTDPQQAAAGFDIGQADLPEVTTAMVDHAASWFIAHGGSGDPFGTYEPESGTWSGQVGAQLAAGGEYQAPDPGTWEEFPYQSAGAYDYYQRQVFRNMTFFHVRIPKANNALFEDCTFVGVTLIETNDDCDHFNWNYTGALEEWPVGSGIYQLKFPDLNSEYGDGIVVSDTRTESNNIRFHGCTFLGSLTGDKPNEHTHWRNRVQFSGPTRFYIDPGDPDLAQQADATVLVTLLRGIDPAERAEMRKSSIFLPGWSLHVGAFEPGTPTVTLRGTIVAGLLSGRGPIDIHGTLLVTFRPVEAQGPLYYGGSPSAFRTTIGHFGTGDSDDEGGTHPPGDPAFAGFGRITLRQDPDALVPEGVPWPIRVR